MYRDEGFAPGRQDLLKAINPVFRSASLIVAPLTFCAQDIRRSLASWLRLKSSIGDYFEKVAESWE